VKIPCLRVTQPIGDFYLANINSTFLTAITYSRLAEFDDGIIEGSQRDIKEARVSEIGQYLATSNATIPNTIILSANYHADDKFETEAESRWSITEEDGHLFINIPNERMPLCSIIDGQHRLRGIKKSGLEIELPCAVFLDLPPSLQAYIFATINFNQQKVDKSLAYQLFGYQLDDSNSSTWSPDILGVKLSRRFNEEGPFKGRIVLIKSATGREKGWRISSASFIEGVVSLISADSKKDKYVVNRKNVFGVDGRSSLQDNESYPLRSFYISGNDKAILMIIERYFHAINNTLWADRNSDDIVFKTVGIAAQFSLLKYLLVERKIVIDASMDFQQLLDPLRGLHFDGEYFSARTATQRRLMQTFQLRLGFIGEDGLDQNIIDCARRP
jgi:DNA phosphorothioation-associated DGQHR protein 1